MGETITDQKGTLQETGQSSVGKDGTTSGKTPETLTREQVRNLISDAVAEQGRKHKAELEPIIKERDTFKAQAKGREQELKDITEKIEKLNVQVDELSSNDPDRFNVVKKGRELEEERKKLKAEIKADRETVEAEKQSNSEAVTLAKDTLREIAIWEVAVGYDSGDPVKLKDLCDIANKSSEEEIRKVADTLWGKKVTESIVENPPLKVDSGKTIGGQTGLSEEERLKQRYPSMFSK